MLLLKYRRILWKQNEAGLSEEQRTEYTSLRNTLGQSCGLVLDSPHLLETKWREFCDKRKKKTSSECHNNFKMINICKYWAYPLDSSDLFSSCSCIWGCDVPHTQSVVIQTWTRFILLTINVWRAKSVIIYFCFIFGKKEGENKLDYLSAMWC